MKVMVELCLIPLGAGVSASKYIAACEKVLEANGLDYKLHAFGTNIEGEWDTVMSAIKQCHEKVHAMGVPSIFTTMKIGTRTDKEQSLADKVLSVESLLSTEAI